jgi:hypothetical protein
LGTITLTELGSYAIEVVPVKIAQDYLAFVKSVTLELVE